MTHDEALRTVAADVYAALQAWTAADVAQADCDYWYGEDDDEYATAELELKALNAWHDARRLTSAVNHRIQELCADSVTSVTLDIGDAE
jgi:hypothetical protein